MRLTFLATCFIGVLSVSAIASAATLITRADSFMQSGTLSPPVTFREAGYRFRISPAVGPTSNPVVQLWADVRFTQANVGQNFTLTPANFPQFALAAALLTDGQANGVRLVSDLFFDSTTGGGGVGDSLNEFVTERNALFGSDNASLPVDLAGATITAFNLHLDSFNIAVTQGAGSTIYTAAGAVTLTIDGTVPEPSGAALAVISACAFGRRRRSSN